MNNSKFENVEISNYIDHVYYINLESRPDRNEEILNEINKVGLLKFELVFSKFIVIL